MGNPKRVGPVVSCEGAVRLRPHVIVVSRSNSNHVQFPEESQVALSWRELNFKAGRSFLDGLEGSTNGKNPVVVTSCGYYFEDESGNPVYGGVMECSHCDMKVFGDGIMDTLAQKPDRCQANPMRAGCPLNVRR